MLILVFVILFVIIFHIVIIHFVILIFIHVTHVMSLIFFIFILILVAIFFLPIFHLHLLHLLLLLHLHLLHLLFVVMLPHLVVHHCLLLGEWMGIDVILGPLRLLVKLPRLSLLHSLQAHPLLIAASLLLVDQLLLLFFSVLKVTEVGDTLGLLDLLLHQPVIHCLTTALVFHTLFFCDFE